MTMNQNQIVTPEIQGRLSNELGWKKLESVVDAAIQESHLHFYTEGEEDHAEHNRDA